MNAIESVKKFRDFTEESLKWCSSEAEHGTERVTQAIDVLLKDISRVSSMSSDSLKALQSLQQVLTTIDHHNYQQLHTSLATLSREHHEIDNYIHPIMEALQFQDRFRQNLDNAVRMLDVWMDYRQKAELSTIDRDEFLKRFGTSLSQVTTMKRERDVIRTYIDGLEDEDEVKAVDLF